MSASDASPFIDLETPYYLIDECALARNLALIDEVRASAGARVLLALKAFALPAVFPLLRAHLDGAAASSLAEARLGHEGFGDAVHLCAPGYPPRDLDALFALCGHVVFNSPTQWQRLRAHARAAPRPPSCGIRINPGHSEVATALYDPCQPHSRLGTRREQFDDQAFDGIDGLHFHNLCGSDSHALARTLAVVERDFGPALVRMRWLNLGGGHQLTGDDYDRDHLCALVAQLRARYDIEVLLEPGEAVVLDAGWLVTEVLDLLPDGGAIVDASASAHAPDVIEMPYRPDLLGAGAPGALGHDYRIGGPTCLAGDYFGEYSFPRALEIGQRVAFTDMACYTLVKNTTFNGVRLPAIAVRGLDGDVRVVRRPEYADYRHRLG